MEPIIKELTQTEIEIASLKRQVDFLKEKIAYLNEQILRQTKINEGFVSILKKLTNDNYNNIDNDFMMKL